MKILYLINFAGKAGTEKYVENLVSIFTEAGESCFFAYNVPGELSEKMAARGIPSLQLEMSQSKALSSAKKLAAYCRDNEIDVIHAQYPMENVIALLSQRYYKNVRVVYTNHLTIYSGLRWRILNRIFTPRDHKIIAVCREGRDIMISNGVCPERIQVIYNGIEPANTRTYDNGIRSELGIADDCFVMSILARYSPEKGLNFLLDALAKLKTLTDKPFCCIICGDGDEFGDVKARASELGLSDSVLQAGYRTDTPRILRGSDIYLNSSSRNEAMSFAILEAMNAGLPLVVTDVGGNRDLAETNTVCGFVFKHGDVDGFAGAILKLMNDEALRAEYSAAALRKIGEEFDLSKLAWDVFHAYQ